MRDEAALLVALQHADSFFPGGGTAFSWGLEPLHSDGQVRDAAAVERFLGTQIERRWASCDRPFLVAAHRAAGDLGRIAEIDRIYMAMVLPRELREGAVRAGGALLQIHRRLGTAGAADYRALVRDAGASGALPVAQGFLWRACGIAENDAAALSAHALSVGVVGAAIRLGIIGHVAAQSIIVATRPLIAAQLATPAAEIDRAHSFAPAADIAAMRHETQSARLFAN